ncbi:MAG: hypothetical protein EXS16_19785 [Gemmataceae bacterium]|nr:hypothetical protein [Gemmataceae bacterium]
MHKWFVGLALASVCGLIQVDSVQALRVAMPSIAVGPQRLADADAVIVGRVIALEPMDVKADGIIPGQGKIAYRIAVVQVTDAVRGVKKDVQTIRVGFIVAGNTAPGVGGINGGVGGVVIGGGIQIQILPAVQPAIQPLPPQIGGGRRPFPGFGGGIQLQVGQDGMFLLAKHKTENFFVATNFNTFVTRENNPNFDNEVKAAKAMAKVLDNPIAALKSNDREDRYMAAAVLIQKYRMPINPTGMAMKQVAIDAAESKLILNGLQGADWKLTTSNRSVPNAFELFNNLGLSAQDGYTGDFRSQQTTVSAMQAWLDKNAEKYVIKKFVVDPNAKAPVIQPGVIQPRPGVRPLPIKIRGKVQILPAPVPQRVPAQLENIVPVDRVVPVPAPAPIRRD